MNQEQLMENILEYRRQSDAFKQSIASRSPQMRFKFYDGPPFTSGDPHYGHLLQSAVKDMVPRWMTMRGYRVDRKWGWDCHGIPAENFVNKQLGITSRKQVEQEFGIQNYIEECRSMVNNVNDARKWFVDHVGRWVDMDNAYFTMDNDFMESVIWVFSELYHQNLIYKGFKVLGYSRALGTALSASEIAEGYEDRQDPAVTIAFLMQHRSSASCALTEDGCLEVMAGIVRNAQGAYLLVHHQKEGLWFFPGGKIEKGETPADALKREIDEEIGVKVTHEKLLGHIKIIHQGVPCRLHYFEIEIEGEPSIQEPDKHNDLVWAERIDSDNELGFAIKIHDLIIDDVEQIQREFVDFCMLNTNALSHDGMDVAPISFLAWTTTPWTLPSNMFLAVNSALNYVMIYDPAAQKYFVLAENRLASLYKDANEYVTIFTLKGDELLDIHYVPLFDYYYQSTTILPQYHDQVHRILDADFVTDDSGTGIAHEAPAFGEDDYRLVASVLPKDRPQDWLFNPVNDHGEFTDEVPDRAGQNVIASNKAIIDYLKQTGRLVKHETINHSYPHCPRTGEPLIYRAIESWFVKEQELTAKTVPAAQDIDFVPESVKNRFVNGLESAPDWNISRTRFWGTPLPIWENHDGSERVVVGSLEELFEYNKPTKQLTKIILVRHGRTDYNLKLRGDNRPTDASRLTEDGLHQAQQIASSLADIHVDAVYRSPLTRCAQTIQPLLDQKNISAEIDERLREIEFPAYQGNEIDLTKFTREGGPVDGDQGESLQQCYERVQEFLQEIATKHAGETVVVCSHGDPTVLMRKAMRGFDYDTDLNRWYINNYPGLLPVVTEYVWAESAKGLDLHRPYIDQVQIVHPENGTVLQRIPEVLDCWFESGSMPYGQDHFLGDNAQFNNKANFIAEGLDQTRGWFRSLHVIGTAVSDQRVFDHCVVTGMVLAEDGKKMSKSKKNFPDPSNLLKQYGADAFRLYVLNSPVVRSEPLRFMEKGVEQILKDVLIPLENVYNFLSTYANVDDWQHPGSELYMMRHAHAVESDELSKTQQTDLTAEGYASLESQTFVEQVLRIQPEVILHTGFVRTDQTAQGAAQVMKEYLGKDVLVEINPHMFNGSTNPTQDVVLETHQQLLQTYAGKRVLMVTHQQRMSALAHYLVGTDNTSWENLEVMKLPIVPLTNELDQWMMAELHTLIMQVDQQLAIYQIEPATRLLTEFIDKVTNWYVRRSRRRFWDNGMSADKKSAYFTLYELLQTYLKLLAPFAPFTTEHIWQQLQKILTGSEEKHGSVHMEYWPLTSEKYIDQQLIEEIATVRNVIKGAMYLRAKHQIKVKQPLQTLEVKL